MGLGKMVMLFGVCGLRCFMLIGQKMIGCRLSLYDDKGTSCFYVCTQFHVISSCFLEHVDELLTLIGHKNGQFFVAS